MDTPVRASMLGIASLVLAMAFAAPAPPPSTDATPVIKQQVRALLDDYARKDVPAILAMLDKGPVLFMGTDISEVAPSPDSIRRFLSNDFRPWDTSRFGDYKSFYVRCSGDMATAFFDVPWQATADGKTRTFVIRIATVWHHTVHGWKLAQMLNAVPTGG